MIASFKIDHTKLRPGLYLSREDMAHDGTHKSLPVTTYELRFTMSNSEADPPLTPAAMHTIEHLGAIYLRSDPEWGPEIIYFGPMGCRTGFYLVMNGKYFPEELAELIGGMCQFIIDWKDRIPGAEPEECGNYRDHNLKAAQNAAAKYLAMLEDEAPGYDRFNYPE